MADDGERNKTEDGKVGKAQGGGDSSGPGNILAGVQPPAESDDQEEQRRDD